MNEYPGNEREPYGYDPYAQYEPQKQKKTGRRAGLPVVLVVLAILTGIASCAVNLLDVQVERREGALTVTVERRIQQDRPKEDLQQSASTARLPEEPAPSAETEGAELTVKPSPISQENYPTQEAGALSLQAIYEKVIPSVASISCQKPGGAGTGTGIVMSQEGYLITNYHVIDNAVSISVRLEGEREYPAQLIGSDEASDLAVLKVEANDLTPAEFGDSNMLRVGDQVVAVGDPLGAELRGTMTDGIISAINRDLSVDGRQMTLLQTNAALNSGNSGGPLINCYGQVIGINTIKMSGYSFSTSVEGLGFAIPVSIAKPIVDELILNGYVSGRPAIGILADELDLRAQFFYNLPAGVVIIALDEGSDALAKGLEVDDVIVGVNDVRISSLDDLAAAKNGLSSGDQVELTIFRRGTYYQVAVTLMDQINPELY